MRYKQNEFKKEYFEIGGKENRTAANKRKIKIMTASATALTVFCISVTAGMASVPDTQNEPDLTGYIYEKGGSETVTEAGSDSGSTDSESTAAYSLEIPSVEFSAAIPETETRKSASVSIERARISSPAAYDVRIMADGESYYVTASGTVEDALEKTGLELGKHDIVTPSLDTELSDQTVITVQRVAYYKVTTSQIIPYETVEYDDDTLEMGESKVVTYGENGNIIRKYRIKKIDGETVSKELISEEIENEPVDEVIAYGTYIPETETYEYEEPDNSYDTETESSYEINTYSDGGAVHASLIGSVSQFEVPDDLYVDADGAPLKYKTSLHGKSCAYTAEEGALMSTGKTVEQGYVAVNPDIIPYGSKLYIVADDGEVYGYAIAADTGGSVGRNDILVDLFMWSYDECIQWGAKDVTIYVLEEETDE